MLVMLAQAAAAPPELPWYKELLEYGALKYMLQGGLFMWPILFCGVLAAAVILERFRSLQFLATDTRALRQQVLELLQTGQAEKALELCSQSQGPVPAVLAAGLRKYVVLQRLNYDPGQIEQQVVKAMEDYAVHIIGALERHLPVLATVASVAPMIGFLGTVQGMITAFADVVQGIGTRNIIEAAANGIGVSLLTTAFGLMIAIPAFTAYNYFTGVINKYVLEVEETASELIEAVTLQTALQQGSAPGVARATIQSA
jgi:biopolymer transport protein ExbB